MRIVWWTLFACSVALSGFLVYLTLTRDDVPVRGFVLAGGILGIGLFSLYRARSSTPPPAP